MELKFVIPNMEKTFGQLKISVLRREVHIQHEDETVSDEIKERAYDLKCRGQGRMASVSVTVPWKDVNCNAEVEFVNPNADTVANATFQGADVDWFIKADNIVLKGKGVQLAGNLQNNTARAAEEIGGSVLNCSWYWIVV